MGTTTTICIYRNELSGVTDVSPKTIYLTRLLYWRVGKRPRKTYSGHKQTDMVCKIKEKVSKDSESLLGEEVVELYLTEV